MALYNEAKAMYHDSDVRILPWSGDLGAGTIGAGANALTDMVNGHTFSDGEQLNVITHSRGGEVALAAAGSLDHPIDNLVTLGLPTGWVNPDMANIKNWSNVSILQDLIASSASNSENPNGSFEAGAHNLNLSLPAYTWHGVNAHSAYWNDPLARSIWEFWVMNQGCHSFVTTDGPHGPITNCAD